MFSLRSSVLVLVLCATFIYSQCLPTWSVGSAAGAPSGLQWFEAVYDPVRSTTIIFGGRSSPVLQQETWEFSQGTWVLKSTSGPPPRWHSCLVFDIVRNRTVMFGGSYWPTVYSDTWEWDGSTWTQRATNGPAPRALHGMAYDAVRNRTVMFGGYTGSASLGDTWEWNGSAWTQVGNGPAPRQGHAMAFDPISNLVLMHGGNTFLSPSTPGAFHRDTWGWNGQTWTLLNANGNTERDGHAMVFVPQVGRMLLYGGAYCCFGWPTHLEAWNGTQWELYSATNSGPSRQDFGLVFDSSASVVRLLFGTSPPGDIHWELSIPAAAGAGTPLGPQSAAAVEWSTSAGGNGHRYEVVAASSACGVTWDQAHDAATAAGGHLATIESSAENLFVFGLINQPQYWATSPSNQDGPWIGGIQRSGSPEPSGGWGWVTSESFAYSAWSTAPDNGCGGQDNRMNYWHPSSRSATWGDLGGAGCGSRRPKAFVVEYEPGLTCPPTVGFGVCALTSTTGPSRLQIMNLPEGTLFGKTLISTMPAYPQGTGSFFGLNADLLTLQILVTPNAVGDPLTWTVSEKGVFPQAPFYFPPSLTAPFAGMTWDFMAVAVSAAGGIQLSSITRSTW